MTREKKIRGDAVLKNLPADVQSDLRDVCNGPGGTLKKGVPGRGKASAHGPGLIRATSIGSKSSEAVIASYSSSA